MALALAIQVGFAACREPEPAAKKANETKSIAGANDHLATLRVFSDLLCQCDDYDCGSAVYTEVLAWARASGISSPELTQNSDWLTLTTCLSRLDVPKPVPPTPSPTPPPPLPPNSEPAVPPSPVTADALRAAVRTWAQANHPELTVGNEHIQYVDVEGVLDAEHGRFETELARVRQVDDPSRKLGAPVPAISTIKVCPVLTFRAAWSVRTRPCTDVIALSRQCSISEIWRRAIAKKAPADALAVIRGKASARSGFWEFSVSDSLRGVNVWLRIEDDCALAVEHPEPKPGP